jgi:hypothetical protein
MGRYTNRGGAVHRLRVQLQDFMNIEVAERVPSGAYEPGVGNEQGTRGESDGDLRMEAASCEGRVPLHDSLAGQNEHSGGDLA